METERGDEADDVALEEYEEHLEVCEELYAAAEEFEEYRKLHDGADGAVDDDELSEVEWADDDGGVIDFDDREEEEYEGYSEFDDSTWLFSPKALAPVEEYRWLRLPRGVTSSDDGIHDKPLF